MGVVRLHAQAVARSPEMPSGDLGHLEDGRLGRALRDTLHLDRGKVLHLALSATIMLALLEQCNPDDMSWWLTGNSAS